MSSGPQRELLPVSPRFGTAFDALRERLYDSINRGPLLKCFLAKTSATRIDLTRVDIDQPVLDQTKNELVVQYGLKTLDAASHDQSKWARQMVRDLGDWARPYLSKVWAQVQHDAAMRSGLPLDDLRIADMAPLSSHIIDSLISNEGASTSFQLDISSEVKEIREQSLSLYKALAQKISRSAELIRKEAGLRSLWLGYPLFLARDLTDPEEPSVILAPLFLWAVDIHVSLSRQGQIKLSRDPKVGPPALNKILQRWVKTNLHVDFAEPELKENSGAQLTRSEIDVVIRKVVGGVSHIQIDALTNELQCVPSKKEAQGRLQPAILNSAVLGIFVSENQSLIDNLSALKSTQQLSEPLERLLSGKSEEHKSLEVPMEKDRYLVAESDPFQEIAVWDSRHSPGTVVHGPPGTGKSQTIVNIVADALAHGERVLVVCQKRAAIDVVSQRIRAAGLSSLCTVVHDSEADRSRVILDIKEQIASIGEQPQKADAQLRSRLAAEIDKLESELDGYYKAVNLPRSDIGLSYRTIVSRLGTLTLQHSGIVPDPEIGEILRSASEPLLEASVSSFTAIAMLYKSADILSNPWRQRSGDFFLTAKLAVEIKATVGSCTTAEDNHQRYISNHGIGVKIDDPDSFLEAAQRSTAIFQQITSSKDLTAIYRWLNSPEECRQTLQILRGLQEDLSQLSNEPLQHRYTSAIQRMPDDTVAELLRICTTLLHGLEGFWFLRLLPRYQNARRRLLKLIESVSLTQSEIKNLKHECLLIAKKREVESTLRAFQLGDASNQQAIATQHRLQEAVRDLLSANEITQLPPTVREVIAEVLQTGKEAIPRATSLVEVATRRIPLLLQLRKELQSLKKWILATHIDELFVEACGGKPLEESLSKFNDYLPKIPDLVAFDSTKSTLHPLESRLLDLLIAADPSGSNWSPILLISTLSRWAEECLRASPILRSLSPPLYKTKTAALAQALNKKRELESDAIMDYWLQRQQSVKELRPSPFNLLRPHLVTRGPNSKRLREVIAVGAENHLFSLRPCWLTNPNTACQIFGLTPGLFDVVVFDEASQCPVEQAVPVIHRGKRVVVSGDEKQLPPTSFFLTFTGTTDPDETDSDAEAELSDQDVAERELQKQLLSSKDLLSVCEPILRSSYLNMHYRSEHPSLIEFSNHAFYGNRLQFPPARASASQTTAIEYHEIGGLYENKQNWAEAKAVVEMLRQIWKEEPCPTIGVVTFNINQQNLIENLIQEEAIKDPDFRLRYQTESAREDGEQQVGFFVKNLESVQGDERDVIIFSTTFGRDSTGAFKRFFGPINMEGGERRLNVAITRAKKRVCVLSSMPISEISEAFSSAQPFQGERITGREYLQGYLLYSKAVSDRNDVHAREILKRARELGSSKNTNGTAAPLDFESDFEIAVYDALRAKGIDLETQVGVAGFRIDLAVKYPEPERGYLMGIECDGKAFHSSFSARARDIWREQILHSRGWRIHRIWSSDWWADPNREVQKVLDAIKRYSC